MTDKPDDSQSPSKIDLTGLGPNASTSDPTDGKKQYQWATNYPSPAVNQMLGEAAYLVLLMLLSHIAIFLIWKGSAANWLCLSVEQGPIFKKYGYYFFSGLLGGVIFGIKYLYRVIARGFWHQDRTPWRILSPWIGSSVALVMGAMLDSALVSSKNIPPSSSFIVSVGFLSGYFADEAVGKMYEVASVVFGKSAKTGG